MSLNNLSASLADAGRRGGLATIESASAGGWQPPNAAAYEPALASSLNNLSASLADAGRRDEAQQAREEAAALIPPTA